jgi:threonine synthase
MVVASGRGNTGVAIARAFQNKKGITTVLLYPDEKIYGLDETTYAGRGGNLIPIRVKGSLDDCQKLISLVIHDRVFAERYNVIPANSINAGRLLPQAFYFLYSFVQLKKRISGDLAFSIPSANFGNLLAALYAWKFGMPVNELIAVTNSYAAEATPAMDISNPYNQDRLVSFYKSSPAVMRNMVFPETADDETTLRAMKTVWDTYGLLIDPHGAAAFAASDRFARQDDFNGHIVTLLTAHPAKYSGLVHRATGQKLILPEHLASLDRSAEPIAEIDADLEALENAIAGSV